MGVIVASSVLQRLRGLFFRRGFSGELLLVPCNDVHTFGMRQPIDVAFIADDGEVLEAFRRVGPCRRLRCSQALITLERFARDEPWVQAGDRVELKRLAKECIAGDCLTLGTP